MTRFLHRRGYLILLMIASAPLYALTPLDSDANQTPVIAPASPAAVALIPKGFRFAHPGELTVAISAMNSPRWPCWATITGPASAVTRISPGCLPEDWG